MSISIIFTRHALTAEQIAKGQLENAISLQAAASRTLTTNADARVVITEWMEVAHGQSLRVFGVFPPILRFMMNQMFEGVTNPEKAWIQTWEAHNINRAPEGQKPEFQFVDWLLTAEYQTA